VAWVRERTIPIEIPQRVGEVSANICGQRVQCGQRDGSLRPYSRFARPDPLLFLPSTSTIVLTKLSRPRSRPTTSQKIWYSREPKPELWPCIQELWPLEHRGGLPQHLIHIKCQQITHVVKHSTFVTGNCVMIKTLCYKPEDRGFETRWGKSMFSVYLTFQATLGPWVHSASNINEYQKQKYVSGE
jgi:hypothetical protein